MNLDVIATSLEEGGLADIRPDTLGDHGPYLATVAKLMSISLLEDKYN